MAGSTKDQATIYVSATGFYIFPTVLGLSGGLFACWQAGFNLLSISGTIVLGAVGFFIGFSLFDAQQKVVERLKQSQRQEESRQFERIMSYVNELERLFLQIVPIVLRQVQTSRSHTEKEITVLTERFAGMTSQLEQIISSTSHAEHGGKVDTLFSDSRDALTVVLRVLGEIQNVEHQVVDQVRDLSKHTQQLDSMAKEVRKVAEQINLLALNAAIEAARAGENGRGFAVVADEVRKLAGFSSSTGEKISKAIQDINAAMAATLKMSETSGSSDEKSIRDAENAIHHALDDLRITLNGFKDDADLLRSNSVRIRDEIFSVLTAFQFQDRVSQMLVHVEHNLGTLNETVEYVHSSGNRHPDSLDVNKTLAKMELSYTMPEELMNHQANTAATHLSSSKNDEVTFF